MAVPKPPDTAAGLLAIASAIDRLARVIERATDHGYLAIKVTIDPDSEALPVAVAQVEEDDVGAAGNGDSYR